jgi:hypothetical protein
MQLVHNEKIKLVIVLAQKIRHVVSSRCGGKQRCIFPVERNHVGIGALEMDVLLILIGHHQAVSRMSQVGELL